MAQQNQSETRVYVGTYTGKLGHVDGAAEGIYLYRFDPTTGALTYVSVAPGITNPSFLAIDPEQRALYAVSEMKTPDGRAGGAVSAYHIDPATGNLTHLNQQSTGGADPCHLSVDATGKFLLVANYTSGSVAMFPIEADGSLGERSDFVQHEGSSIDPNRQQGPHAHSFMIDPGNRYAFAPDLGMDKVMQYKLDLAQGKLIPNDPPWVQIQAGQGPRHFDFHPSRRYAYVINELGSTVTAFAYDEAQGTLNAIQTLSTLPANFSGRSHCADIHVHPSGQFVYGSNRGHDSIAIFSVDEATGQLTALGHESTQGRTPRNFAIDPTGTILLAANQDTSTVVTFWIDAQTGKLTPTGEIAAVPTPVCLKLVQVG
jgi:6-phosphogluconolactonase